MAFTKSLDNRLSPNFRSMRPDASPSPFFSGLMSPSTPQTQSSAPDFSTSTAQYQPIQSTPSRQQLLSQPVQSTPSRQQLLTQPARNTYAKSTPPAVLSPQQLWRTPEYEPIEYPNPLPEPNRINMGFEMQMPITAGLLDDPNMGVASQMDAEPMDIAPPAVAEFDPSQIAAPGFPQPEVLVPQNAMLGVDSPEYITPAVYQPLMPSRRYEVL